MRAFDDTTMADYFPENYVIAIHPIFAKAMHVLPVNCCFAYA